MHLHQTFTVPIMPHRERPRTQLATCSTNQVGLIWETNTSRACARRSGYDVRDCPQILSAILEQDGHRLAGVC